MGSHSTVMRPKLDSANFHLEIFNKHTSINEEKAPQTCESHVPNKGGGDTAGYLATPGGLGVPTLQAPGGSGVPGCSCPNIVTGLRLLATDCLRQPN